MKNCCIFDLDGTLINTVDTLAYFVNETFAYYGLEAIEAERFKKLSGDGARNLIKRSLALRLDSWTEDFETEVLNRYNQAYDNDFTKLCRVYDGIKPLTAQLKQMNFKLAVLTNKPQSTASKTIETFFPKNTFDVVMGQRDGLPLKPDPQGVFRILEEFGAAPEMCVYLGDTNTDMQTGKSAGLFTVGVLWGFRERAEIEAYKPDAIIAKPAELLEVLSRLGNRL